MHTFCVREATASDAAHIAEAHVDSIRSLGVAAYDPELVADWGAPRTADRYLQAMANGERYFVAVDGDGQILGFAAHRVESGEHRVATYVRGSATRRGVGTALFTAAEALARAARADQIYVDASLVAVAFYEANGFCALESASHRLRSGRQMACVKMHKPLTRSDPPPIRRPGLDPLPPQIRYLPGMSTTQLAIPTADGTCPAHEFTPATPGPWPAVLVFMDGIGIRPTLISHCERLAAAGYYALLPDLFYRSGPYEPQDPVKLFSDPATRAAWFTRHIGTTDSAAVMRDVPAYLDHIAHRPNVHPGPVGAVGYCMGGRMALTAAGTYPERFAAVAAYHPGNLADASPDSPHLLAARITARVYVAGASDDTSFPDEQKQRLAAALTAAQVDHSIETYPAKHGWVFADTPIYDPACNERHWTSLLALFARTLARP